WDFPVRSDNDSAPAGPTIVLEFSAAISGNEAYRLRASGGGIVLAASSPAGAYYATQTLLQLLPPAVYAAVPRPELEWSLPAVEITDAPRFRWRGIMVDSARYYQPVSFLRRF